MKIHPRQWAFCLLTVLLLAGMGSPTLQTTNAPNSFDIYVDAGEQLVRDKDIGDVYVNADGQGTLIRKRALVQDNQRALSRVRQGFAFAYRNPPIRSLDATMPYFTKYRSLVRLLAMESEVYAADGNYTQAVLCGLDAMHLGKDVPHGSVTIGALVGLACQSIGRKPLWGYVEHLDSAAARQAIQRLESINADLTPLAATLAEEQQAVDAVYAQWLADPAAFKRTLEENTQPINLPASIIGTISGPMLTEARAEYNHYMQTLITTVNTPYPTWTLPPKPKNGLTQIWLIDFHKLAFNVLNNEAQNRLLLTRMAIHAYRADHGMFPDQLGGLSPAYLRQVPADPFAENHPLRYQRTGDTYVLYSIGPDTADDGGKAAVNPQETDRSKRHRVALESTGDIVAGVNID